MADIGIKKGATDIIGALDRIVQKSNPEGINQYTKGGGTDSAEKASTSQEHTAASKFHEEKASEHHDTASKLASNGHVGTAQHDVHLEAAKEHMNAAAAHSNAAEKAGEGSYSHFARAASKVANAKSEYAAATGSHKVSGSPKGDEVKQYNKATMSGHPKDKHFEGKGGHYVATTLMGLDKHAVYHVPQKGASPGNKVSVHDDRASAESTAHALASKK